MFCNFDNDLGDANVKVKVTRNQRTRLLEGPCGVLSAINGMRYSHDSEARSDSGVCSNGQVVIGDDDLVLMKRLIRSGSEHRAFMRQIVFWWNMKMPMSFWKQFDTYRFGVEKRSRSTMHKIMTRPLTTSDFTVNVSETTINVINEAIADFDVDFVINNLPMGYLQERVVMTSAEALFNINKQRANHRLGSWSYFLSDVEAAMEISPEVRLLIFNS